MRNFDMVNRLLFAAIVLLMMLVAVAILYTFLTFGVLGLIGALIIGPASVYVTIKFFRGNTIAVQEGTVVVIERLGAFNRILYPGSAFLLDPFDKPRRTLETGEQLYEFTAEEVLVGSSATLNARVLVRYRLGRREAGGREIADEQCVYKATYEVDDWKKATERQAQATLRDVLGETGWRDEFIGVTAEGDTIVARPRSRLNAKMRFLLERQTERWGVNVSRCSVQVLHVDADSLASAFAVRRARRRAAIASIDAQSEKEVAVRRFEADLAKIKMQAAAIREGLPTVDFVALKWIEAIERLAQDPQSKWVIPVEFLETVRQITGVMQQRARSGGLAAIEPPPEAEEPPSE